MPGDATPNPPRYRWFRRLAYALAGLVLLAVLLRVVSGAIHAARLDAAVQALREAGEPLSAAELELPSVAPEANAATHFAAALEAWPRVETPESQSPVLMNKTSWFQYLGNSPDPVADDREYLERCATAIEHLRRAADAPHCVWGSGETGFGRMLPRHFRTPRDLNNVVSDAAMRAHRVGNDALAVELVRLQLTIADKVAIPPSGTNILYVIAMRASALERLESILPDLRIGEPPAASASSIDRLVGRLLDDEAARAEVREMLRVDRALALETAQGLIDGRESFSRQMTPAYPLLGSDTLTLLAARPLLWRDTVALLDAYARDIRAAETASSWPGFESTASPPLRRVFVDAYLHPMRITLHQPFTVENHFQARARARLAAAAIAVRRYEVEHGRRPATLDELVPTYLPHVPTDPLDAGGAAIRYRPDGVLPTRLPGRDIFDAQGRVQDDYARRGITLDEKRLPILYSVGEDGADHGGVVLADGRGVRLDRRSSRYGDPADLYFMLDPAPDPPLPYREDQDTPGNEDFPDTPSF